MNKKVIVYILIFIFCIGFIIYWYSLPSSIFDTPCNTVLYSSDGKLLNARTSADEQWRFPHNPNVPEKFAKCILAFEDQYFYYHNGVNPVSILRALWQNISSRKIKSGGSTITMQVIRLHRQDKPRTIKEKIIEIILATRLELRYSKNKYWHYTLQMLHLEGMWLDWMLLAGGIMTNILSFFRGDKLHHWQFYLIVRRLFTPEETEKF